MKALAVLALTLFSSLAIAEDETPFDITEMEQGESVTLPSPATSRPMATCTTASAASGRIR